MTCEMEVCDKYISLQNNHCTLLTFGKKQKKLQT